MKKRFLQTLFSGALMLTGLFASAQLVPNGGFEQALNNGWVIVSAQSAQNAARISTLNYDNGQEVRQITSWGGEYFLFLANTSIRSTVRTQPFALTTQPKGIRFQLMYFRPGSQFNVGLQLTKTAVEDSLGNITIDTIRNVTLGITPSSAAIFPWQDFYLPIPDSMYNGEQPDSIMLTFSAGPTANAAIAIDDVVLVDYAASEGPLSYFTGGVKLYPSPASNFINVNYTLNMQSQVKMDIYDVQGRVVKNVLNESQYNGEHNNQIDVSELKSGIYLLRINSNDKVETIKFTVE